MTWPFPTKPLPDKPYKKIPVNPDNYEESPL
jgi:hypothetical protein